MREDRRRVDCDHATVAHRTIPAIGGKLRNVGEECGDQAPASWQKTQEHPEQRLHTSRDCQSLQPLDEQGVWDAHI